MHRNAGPSWHAPRSAPTASAATCSPERSGPPRRRSSSRSPCSPPAASSSAWPRPARGLHARPGRLADHAPGRDIRLRADDSPAADHRRRLCCRRVQDLGPQHRRRDRPALDRQLRRAELLPRLRRTVHRSAGSGWRAWSASQVLALREAPYITAAQASGASTQAHPLPAPAAQRAQPAHRLAHDLPRRPSPGRRSA